MRTQVGVLLTVLIVGLLANSEIEAQSGSGPRGGTRVRSRIRLQLSEVSEESSKPTLQVAVDAEPEFNTLAADRPFLASGPVTLTVRRYNPLKTALTVVVNDAADPVHSTVGSLVESLLGMTTVLGAKLPTDRLALTTAQLAGCSTYESQAQATVKALDAAFSASIWGSKSVLDRVDTWTRTIESRFNTGHSGPAALEAAREQIAAFLGGATQPGEGEEPLDWAAKESTGLAEALSKVDVAIKAVNDALTGAPPPSCGHVIETYRLLRLSAPSERRHRLSEMVKSMKAIHDSLASYARPARWSQADLTEFRAKDSIEPTAKTLKNLEIKFSSISYEIAQPSAAVSAKKVDVASSKIVVRRYLAWVPEIGVGLTFSSVDRPTYGTGKDDAGRTVITEGKPDGSSIDPAVMMNFVCGFCRLSAVTPMFQIGTSASKSTPALFLGGGFKLVETPKGDFAIGLGWVIPFAKQLKPNVSVGKVIDGSTDLDSNLEWKRVKGQHPYVTLQYKF